MSGVVANTQGTIPRWKQRHNFRVETAIVGSNPTSSTIGGTNIGVCSGPENRSG